MEDQHIGERHTDFDSVTSGGTTGPVPLETVPLSDAQEPAPVEIRFSAPVDEYFECCGCVQVETITEDTIDCVVREVLQESPLGEFEDDISVPDDLHPVHVDLDDHPESDLEHWNKYLYGITDIVHQGTSLEMHY